MLGDADDEGRDERYWEMRGREDAGRGGKMRMLGGGKMRMLRK